MYQAVNQHKNFLSLHMYRQSICPPEHFCFFSSKSTSIEGLLELVVKVLVDRKRWIVFTRTRTETKLTFYGQYFLQTKRVGDRNGNYHWHSSYQLQRVRGDRSRNHRAIAVQLKRWITSAPERSGNFGSDQNKPEPPFPYKSVAISIAIKTFPFRILLVHSCK